MKTLAEFEATLEERGLSAIIHQGASPGPDWLVWIYAPDDPIIHFEGEGDTLEAAILDALRHWNREGAEDTDEEPAKSQEPN